MSEPSLAEHLVAAVERVERGSGRIIVSHELRVLARELCATSREAIQRSREAMQRVDAKISS